MEMVTIEFKLPKEVYDRASEILAAYGLTVEQACVLFLKETVAQGRLPFSCAEQDLEEASKMEKMMNDDLCDI